MGRAKEDTEKKGEIKLESNRAKNIFARWNIQTYWAKGK
jgi:hypothetical protein